MRLENQVAIITGAGSGIGKAMAVRFAAEGCIVAVSDIKADLACSTCNEIHSIGGRAIAVQADVADKRSVQGLVSKVHQEFHGIDVLVNNAGVLHSTSLADITEEEWDRILSINLKGVFLTCQAVIPIMEEQGNGCIINIASNAGRDGGVSVGLAYAASKAGVIGFTRGLAKREARRHITCNCIAPGTTKSDLLKAFTPEMIGKLEETIPLGRLGDPEDIAELAIFLAGAHGRFVTGAVLDINGGLFIG
jgi:3-oxoacyl-[acyl-carrier protein] reductase